MKKIIVVVMMLMVVVTGCSSLKENTEALTSNFNIEFSVIDNEKHTATFKVFGLPNEEEFNQIDDVIIDSLKDVAVKDMDYTISVVGEDEKIINYGTVIYNNGELKDNKLVNITKETYDEYLVSIK